MQAKSITTKQKVKNTEEPCKKDAYEHIDGKKITHPPKKDRLSVRFGTYNLHVTRPEILLEVLTETTLHSAVDVLAIQESWCLNRNLTSANFPLTTISQVRNHNLITIDFKLPNYYFQSAKQAVGPQLKFEWKRKVDISPVAHSFPMAPAYLMNAPVDDILTFFYDNYCSKIDTLAKKNTRKTTMKHPGFIHDYEIKQLKIKKNKLLRNLQNTATLQDRQTIKDKLKVINKTIQKRVKYAKNERKKKDLLQVNADMKGNPKKVLFILKRVEHVREGEVNTRFSFFTKLLLTTKAAPD
eukprot:g11341.t1